MDLERLIKARAYRILRHLESYQETETLPFYAKEVVLQANEQLLGVYENFLDQPNESIIITTLGLHTYLNDQWVSIRYDQIRNTGSPPKKLSTKELMVYLYSGEMITIAVKGGQEKTQDVWEFLRFLLRVIGDIRKRL